MEDAARFFDEHGYYHARGVFDPAEIAGLEEDFDRIVAQISAAQGETIDATWDSPGVAALARPTDRILHTHNVQRYARRWLDALLSEAFLTPVRAILGPDVVLHHSKLFQKPPEHGSPFPMHQDWPNFPTERDRMIAGIVHVSEATDAMGCLRVYPGSHRLGRIEGADGRSENATLARYPIEDAAVIEAQAGDIVFFHYFTLHGSMPNRSDRTRKTVLVQMYDGTDRVEPGCTHPDEALVLSGWNHGMTRRGAGSAAA